MKRDLIILSLLCLFLALWGGFPFAPIDVLLSRSLALFEWEEANNFFHKPALIINLNAAVYGLIFLFKRSLGSTLTVVQFAEFYYIRNNLANFPLRIPFFLPGQIITACFSVLGVISTYLAAFRLSNKRLPAFFAGLFLCTSLLWVADSHFITPDVPLASLCITTVLLTLVFTQKRAPLEFKHLLYLGLFLGLTISAKYNGALIFVAIAFLMAFYYGGSRMKCLLDAFIVGITGVVVFFAINPLIILKFNEFVPEFMYQVTHAKIGHFGWKTDNGWVFHLTHTLRFGYSVFPIILAVGGIFFIALSKRISTAHKFGILIFPILFYFSMGKSKLAYQRYIIPIIPFLAIFSSFCAYRLSIVVKDFIKNPLVARKVTAAVFAVIVALSIFPNIKNSSVHDYILGRIDTRQEFFHIISNAGLTNDLSIFCDQYTSDYVERVSFKPAPQFLPSGMFYNPMVSINGSIYFHNRVDSDGGSDAPGPKQRIGRMLLGPDLYENSSDIMIFDSFSHDRLIYTTEENWEDYPEPHYSRGEYGFWSAVLRHRYINYEDLYVIQISPFNAPKENVPFSRKSVYSPYLPDLYYRSQPGPFIEIYCNDERTALQIKDSCKRNRVEYSYLRGKDAYYFRKINEELDREQL